ncbi:MAG: NAD-dependent epimerase/dehydratase family protein [Dyella sp.]
MRMLITGATGLVGQGVMQECFNASDVSAVVALGRRPSGKSHAKLSELICADFSQLDAIEDQLQGFDACLYCAGAPPIGTAEAIYRQVTLGLTTHVAAVLARHNPHILFLYISGAHSDPTSRIMPLRIKGETERALQALPLRSVMLRTGGIQPVGDVHSPHPKMESMYRLVGPLMGLGVTLMPGLMTSTDRVGRAMLALARQDNPPPVVENAEINRLGD